VSLDFLTVGVKPIALVVEVIVRWRRLGTVVRSGAVDGSAGLPVRRLIRRVVRSAVLAFRRLRRSKIVVCVVALDGRVVVAFGFRIFRGKYASKASWKSLHR